MKEGKKDVWHRKLFQNTKYKIQILLQNTKKCRNTIRMTFSDLFYHFNDNFLVHLLLYQ